MSNPNEPSENTKPVVKDKNPHNYRKVGYSMIVISVSLVLIGLLVWAIGDNYHFSTDIMANQEIDAMTPKHGYTIVFYDTAQPIGAKLKLLDSASTIDDAQQKLVQYSKQLNTDKATVLVFNETFAANQKQVTETIDAISKVQASIAQAIKDQEAKAQAAQSAPPPTPAPVTPTTSTSNATSSNLTKTVTSTPQTAIPINGTVVTHVSNVPLTNESAGANSENMGIGTNVTVAKSANSTTIHVQNVTLSESIGIKTQ